MFFAQRAVSSKTVTITTILVLIGVIVLQVGTLYVQKDLAILSTGTLAAGYSREYMLQRFYSGRGYGALTTSGGKDLAFFGQGATIHYARQEGYCYLADNGTITNVDPSGTWPTITGGWYALFNTSQFHSILGEMLSGAQVKDHNPTAYPIVPTYEVWFYNFETIPKPAMKSFLGNLSTYIRSLQSEAKRELWIIFSPCWEFNQGPLEPAGSGWGCGGISVVPFCRGWNIPASVYNAQILNWMEAKNELGITNILIASHVAKLWSKTYDPHYLEGIRAVDVIGGSAYDDNATDKFAKLHDFWETVGGNKPLYFFEYNMNYLANHNADAAHVYETYSLVPSYPMLRGLSWWCPTTYDAATHSAVVQMTRQYNGY